MSGSRKLFRIRNKFHVVASLVQRQRRCDGRRLRIELKPWNNEKKGGERNEDAVFQQLERPVYTQKADKLT